MYEPPEATRHHNSLKLLVLLPVRTNLLCTLQCETPCNPASMSKIIDFFVCEVSTIEIKILKIILNSSDSLTNKQSFQQKWMWIKFIYSEKTKKCAQWSWWLWHLLSKRQKTSKSSGRLRKFLWYSQKSWTLFILTVL